MAKKPQSSALVVISQRNGRYVDESEFTESSKDFNSQSVLTAVESAMRAACLISDLQTIEVVDRVVS